jgi:hypothetical protein
MGISLSDGNQFGTRNPSISSRTTNTQGASTQTLLQVHFSLYCILHYVTANKCILTSTTDVQGYIRVVRNNTTKLIIVSGESGMRQFLQDLEVRLSGQNRRSLMEKLRSKSRDNST